MSQTFTDQEIDDIIDAGGSDKGWLRERFIEMGVIGFDDWDDTSTEYEVLDQVAKDRERSTTSNGPGRRAR